jgi:hypothetical protein
MKLFGTNTDEIRLLKPTILPVKWAVPFAP